jgi:3-hydroxyisobutyrate dehydrogenase-like beta-hydroxyacid dehydrogenase
MKIAFLGLGQMGAAIAANLLKTGNPLTVWNRSPERAQALVAAGATLAATPGAAAQGAEVVFSMLADDKAVEAVLDGPDGLLEGLAAGALHVSHSTIAVATAERLAALHADRGQHYLSAPVFGRPDVAAAAKLSIVTAGDPADIDRAEPLLKAIGQRIYRVGDTPSAANLVKLGGNFMICAAIEAMAEAAALVRKGGIGADTFLDVVTGALFDVPVYRNYGAMIAADRFVPAGFTAPLGLKDLRLAGEAAEAQGVAMPLLDLMQDHLRETIAEQGEAVDWSAIGRTVARKAGLG